ncbi:acetyltransferase [Agarivorans sp. Z349TD_8]|uniref:acetyltransferase n=1 Tax=Agarivorans sp. Z349TD_8 TaxID=3421434 RepID=UPI003D7EB1BB
MDIVIYGIGDLAKLLTQYINNSNSKHNSIIAYTADKKYCIKNSAYGKPLIPFNDLSSIISTSNTKILLAIGYKNMRIRKEAFDIIKSKGYSMASYVSESAHIDSSVKLGENSIIFPGTIIEPFCNIGDNNILWSGATICHDCIIGDHNFIAANATLGGKTYLGNSCFIGFNATIIQQLEITDETLIGAGSVVVSSTEPNTKYYGVPAKPIEKHISSGIMI